MRKKIALALLIVGCLAVASIPAHAAKGGSGNGKGKGNSTTTVVVGSISLNETDPHLGGNATFTVNAGSVREPLVNVECFQSGVKVYGATGWAGDTFLLGGSSSDWVRAGGGANCTARLFFMDGDAFSWIASTTFDAAG